MAMHVLRAIVQASSYFLAKRNLHLSFEREGLVRAVETRDTARLYEWLVGVLSFQGISDTAARSFMGEHGSPSWEQIAAFLETASCPKLVTHWNFANCGFVRSHGSCNTPDHYGRCPVPALPLRNGSLNRMAFSLFLFLRDVCEGDLVGWIDRRLESVSDRSSDDYAYRLGQALIQPMRGIHGASDKVLNMALSDFLIAVDPTRELWRLAGSHMVAIDSLVHNLLHRTGTLAAHGAEHAYGPTCYRPGKCADIVRQLAHEYDARELDPSFPKVFPRLVQHALWHFCAQEGLNICNGVQIDDALPCENVDCPVFEACGRLSLRGLRLGRLS